MLLAIDTSSKACSCALIDGDKLVSECYVNTGMTHSATLMPLVEGCLKQGQFGFEDITCYAVSNGPGSYTGLRIGIAAVKGMAYAKNTPCCGVSTLLSLAYNVKSFEGTVCAVLDARVNQVFTALFKIEDGKVTRLTEDMALPISQLEAMLPLKVLAVGDGALLLKEKIKDKEILTPNTADMFQRASSVGFAAIDSGEFLSPGSLAPNYHRASQAERERKEKSEKGDI